MKSNVETLKIEIKDLKLQIAKNSGIVALYNSEHAPSSAGFVHNARRKKFQNERANRKRKDALGNVMNIDNGSKKWDHQTDTKVSRTPTRQRKAVNDDLYPNAVNVVVRLLNISDQQ